MTKAWAIDTGSSKFIGTGWFQDVVPWARPRYAGHNWMLWPTRREARAALTRVKGPAAHGRFPDARVVAVTITLTPTRARRV